MFTSATDPEHLTVHVRDQNYDMALWVQPDHLKLLINGATHANVNITRMTPGVFNVEFSVSKDVNGLSLIHI